MLGLADLARRKISLKARADSPTYISRISAPLTARKFSLASVASAFTVNVLEHPGGPYNSIPFLPLILNLFNLSGNYATGYQLETFLIRQTSHKTMVCVTGTNGLP